MAYLRCIPNLTIFAPMNEMELRNMMFTAQNQLQGPLAIRYPRGRGIVLNWKKPFKSIPLGKAQCLKKGTKLAVLSIGHIGNTVASILDDIDKEGKTGHYNMRFVKPLDHEMLRTIFDKYEIVFTVEDGCAIGGFGSAILEFASKEGIRKRIKVFGVPDRFIDQGNMAETHILAEIDTQSLKESIKSTL